MSVRAKFYVNKVEAFGNGEHEGRTVQLSAVYENMPGVDGNAAEENKIFGQWTPSATCTMTIYNRAAWEQFVPNKVFYVDFTEAE